MKRSIFQEDAIQWLKDKESIPGESYFASLPDYSEFPNLSLIEWKNWFQETASLILQKTAENDVTIFFQSDIKHEGKWVDKSYLCQKAAEEIGHELLWHKVACRAPAGVTTFGRPAFSHILCFSKNFTLNCDQSTPDVLPEMGEKSWQRGIGLKPALMIAKFIKENVKSHTLINPFCGEGAMLACANHQGMEAIGIEKGKKRAERAQLIKVSEDSSCFL
jgi:hypothetical protein